MCGIAGSISFAAPVDVNAVRAMTDAIAHRGPDASGIKDLGPVVLGHRRLSIIDTSASNNQPLPDKSEQFWISFNGEIYNFHEIQAELEKLGSTFRTKGDTEVILEAYKHWGVDCIQRLTGMFVFALWDLNKQRLLIARDRMGEKPLFYSRLKDGGFAFASEPSALLQHPQVAGGVDPVALGQYLSLNYTIGERHLLQGVRRLPPGHFVLIDANTTDLNPRPYWNLAEHFRNKRQFGNEEDAAEELRELVDRSVQACLISDVPVGAFLSGGLDSSSVVASMLKALPSSQVKTFTIGFGESSFDEVEDAKFVADSLKVDHHSDILAPDLASLLKNFIAAAAEPVADTSFLPTYLLAQFARKKITVALSGDGGDELFAGYETYAADRLHDRLKWIPEWARATMLGAAQLLPVTHGKVSFDYKLRQFLPGLAMSSGRAHYSWRNIFNSEEKLALIKPEWRELISLADPFQQVETYLNEVQGCHYLDQAMYMDIKTFLPDDILVKVDRATMSHGLESRAPFLNHKLVEFAASLPVEYKMKGMRKKHLLKETMKTSLPERVIEKRKQGFSAPVSSWLDGPLKSFADDVLSDHLLADWFDMTYIEKLRKDHGNRVRDNGYKLFGLVCFGIWLGQLKTGSRVKSVMSESSRASTY